eukprot:TRINITY_DN100756_c0_g1_i1.p1 TRINITY_DN100756_c0_g1~~TRINITY_DN100756_c0_g1_i1.p1  ORF type:complete len:297 (+),score=60.98 TRINITY_DN100756_c0_g1_i1:101-991(+)
MGNDLVGHGFPADPFCSTTSGSEGCCRRGFAGAHELRPEKDDLMHYPAQRQSRSRDFSPAMVPKDPATDPKSPRALASDSSATDRKSPRALASDNSASSAEPEPPPPLTPGADRLPEDTEETYDDGSVYIGQLVHGQRHGRGVWRADMEQFEGQWERDQRHGFGRQLWEDGRLFEGYFEEGKFHGRGRMEWHSPEGLMIYEGEYVKDMKHGRGKYTWPDGRSYDGEWRDGMRHGRAVYSTCVGVARDSIWKDDQPDVWLDNGASSSNSKPEVSFKTPGSAGEPEVTAVEKSTAPAS